MRRRLITPTSETVRSSVEGWLDVERAAVVEFTSEDNDYPVDCAFISGESRGWRAAAPGSQTIRLVFDQPQRLKHISLVFEENEIARTQEFVLRWSPDAGSLFREIVRQQWNFSPPGNNSEVEDYQVELSNVTVLELIITPNMSGGDARASLKSMRLS
ncbi:MAG: carbohydrate-binding protein [Acidobacteriia bacterium]|nr:carbohydrate-binding protein [Terriglobia bacterium]